MFRSNRRRSHLDPFWRDLIDRWKASGHAVWTFDTAGSCRIDASCSPMPPPHVRQRVRPTRMEDSGSNSRGLAPD
jgi:hypothetical protein